MKLLRYLVDGTAHYGILDNSDVYTLIGDPFRTATAGDRVGALGEVHLLPPCVPSKIIAVGLNYPYPSPDGQLPLPDEPILTLKPPSTLIASGQEICWPRLSSRIDFEGEMAIVIGRLTHDVEPSEARASILGVTCANDVTARDLQRRDGQWARAKGFDTFCPLGPFIATEIEPGCCHLVTRVNREVRQDVSTAQLHFAPTVLISHISRIMTLVPGDVILTGTPSGSGALKLGDVVDVEIDGVGVLTNKISS